MRGLQRELLCKKLLSRQEFVMADVLDRDYYDLKARYDHYNKLYDRYMECCGYTRYFYIEGINYCGNYEVMEVWLKGDHKSFRGYKLYTTWIEAALVCNHMSTD